MCGRFAFYSPDEAVVRLFDVSDVAPVEPGYNLAPTQPVPVVRAAANGQRRLDPLRWGLVPFWAKDLSIGNRMINARAETVAEKPAFRAALRKRRCIVLANGFYEWQRAGDRKQPFYITREDGEPFAMAGLWESWRERDVADAQDVETCTIITTGPNALMEQIHRRMPVIRDPEPVGQWWDGNSGVAELQSLLAPYTGGGFVAVPVSTRVNNARNQGAELIEPAGEIVRA
jgi:putative SOS response-associated peptidase YedK